MRGSLSTEAVRGVVHQHIDEVDRCFHIAGPGRAAPYGQRTLTFVISPHGKVQSAFIKEPAATPWREVDQCLKRVALGWRFPRPQGNGIVIVSYPFQLGV